VRYIERLDFLIQSLNIKLDDEFLVHVLKFYSEVKQPKHLSSFHPYFRPTQSLFASEEADLVRSKLD
jgi:hypothetical protein